MPVPMQTIKPAIPPSLVAAPDDAVRRDGPSDFRLADAVSEEHDGLRWIIRSGFEHGLATVPASAWADPAGQGWSFVKKNGRREVWRAEIDQQVYFLKYYFRGGLVDTLRALVGHSSCRAEWDGGRFALRHDIPAVEPVAYTRALRRDGRACELLVTASVEPCYPLNHFWRLLQSDDDRARRSADTAHLIDRLAELIARAHQAGFEHTDMHAENILVQPIAPRTYRCVFVDLHSSRRDVRVCDRAVVRNLAQLNQWFRRNGSVSLRLRFLRAYLRWRGEFEHEFTNARPLGLGFEQLVDALKRAADTHAQQLWAQRDRRIFRTGRYFGRVRLANGWRGQVYCRSKHEQSFSPLSARRLERDWWRPALATLLGRLAAGQLNLCKDSHSAIVARETLAHSEGDVTVIVKKPIPRNLRRRLAMWLSQSRSRRGWRTGNALLHRNVATARPLALLERRVGPFARESVLLTEVVPEAVDLEAHLRAEYPRQANHEWAGYKRTLVERLTTQLRELEPRHFRHRDCKAGNILVVEQPTLQLLWIDMDGLQHLRRPPSANEVRAAFVRLHVSLLDIPGLTRTDRVRFLKRYFARFGMPVDRWRNEWRRATPMVIEKCNRLERRRAWKQARYGRT